MTHDNNATSNSNNLSTGTTSYSHSKYYIIQIWSQIRFEHIVPRSIQMHLYFFLIVVNKGPNIEKVLPYLAISLSLYEYSSNKNHQVMIHHSPVLGACSTWN